MADLPAYPGTPRWVKVAGGVVIVLVLLFAILQLTGVIGEHGPGRHRWSAGPDGRTPLSVLAEGLTRSPALHGRTPPDDGHR